jgi:hypothetical protein
MDGPLISWRVPERTPALPARKVLPLLRAAVVAAPDRRDIKLQLVRVLFENDRMAEVVDCARPLVATGEATPELLYLLGRAAMAISDYDLAIEALRSAAQSGFAGAHAHLSTALLESDRIDAAIAAGLEGLQYPTRDFRCLLALGIALVIRGQEERLWKLCVDLRAGGAWGGYFPAVLAFAAEAVGQTDQVADILDPTRWYSATQIEVPGGFNASLAAELLAHKSLGPVHSTKVTRGAGVWIHQLELYGGPLAQQLLVMIRSAVEAYVFDRRMFADQPIMARRPACADLESWAIEVHGDGFQAPHTHPAGWLSGVYYVNVPTVNTASDACAGAIEFGLLSLGKTLSSSRVARWRVMPRPGLLLLFPSYFAHWTRPTATEEPRISVAFDVVAAPETA